MDIEKLQLSEKIKRLKLAIGILERKNGKVVVNIGTDAAYIDVSELISLDMGRSQVTDILNGELIYSQELFAKL